METGLNELVIALANVFQVAALMWISRRTREVRQELVDVLEWVRDPENGARSPFLAPEKPHGPSSGST